MYIGIDASRITAEEKTGTESYSFNLINALQIVDNKNKYTLYLNKPHKYFEPTAKNFTVKYIPFPRLWTQGRLALECLMNPPDVLFVPAHTIPVIRRPSLKTVVTIQPRKNLVNLIEAFSKIRVKDIDLVLVGKPGWLYDEIYKAPKKFGVEDRVKFLGYVPINELPALYSGASGLALVSLYEGFGLPVLEAMAAGCPCLVSNQSSLPEVAGDAALTVDP